MPHYLGYQWLADAFALWPVQRFRIASALGGSRSTTQDAGYALEVYPSSYNPSDAACDHLRFALRYEGVHLEFLQRLFQTMPDRVLIDWLIREPSSQYARRAGFLLEWLTGRSLGVPDVGKGNYVDALSADDHLTAGTGINHKKWRVRDNLPGTPDWCPVVYRNSAIRAVETRDVGTALKQLQVEFGDDTLQRSAVWLTTKESRASFAIEHEADQEDRLRRFAAVMARRTGFDPDSPFANLTDEALIDLQRAIVGERALDYGMRDSTIFVGDDHNHVHYIAPPAAALAGMLDGLRAFADTTQGRSPALRAAVLSFGFVYIHPMRDGNGRISRFLINDSLRRDNAIPAPFILPVSATIASNGMQRARYDNALEGFSRPLMQRHAADYSFDANRKLTFSAEAVALPAWRYPDLTDQAVYLADIIMETIHTQMREEADYLRRLQTAKEGIKIVLEGANSNLDRIVRSIHSTGDISRKLEAEFPRLVSDKTLRRQLVQIVGEAFEGWHGQM
ncbi:MAG: Fic family protein [Rhodanobacter sp.]|nr:MAG: Fic family protein [Rhodanobacter sp.]TAL98965.1 MAG: Fic family protein [Rhodanobacter sp.]TAM43252.1 MAG: Fic family protein [Rhodanobacter sp.]